MSMDNLLMIIYQLAQTAVRIQAEEEAVAAAIVMGRKHMAEMAVPVLY